MSLGDPVEGCHFIRRRGLQFYRSARYSSFAQTMRWSTTSVKGFSDVVHHREEGPEIRPSSQDVILDVVEELIPMKVRNY